VDTTLTRATPRTKWISNTLGLGVSLVFYIYVYLSQLSPLHPSTTSTRLGRRPRCLRVRVEIMGLTMSRTG
jgi:hypothetical protein